MHQLFVPMRIVAEVRPGTTRKAVEVSLMAHDLSCLRHHQPPGEINGSVTIAVPEGEEERWASELPSVVPIFVSARTIMIRPLPKNEAAKMRVAPFSTLRTA